MTLARESGKCFRQFEASDFPDGVLVTHPCSKEMIMAVQVLSFHCTLKNKLGHVISSTFNHNVLTHSSDTQVPLKALSDALQGLRKGDRKEIFLRADEAYGFYHPDLVIVRALDEINVNSPLKLGEEVVYATNGESKTYRVTEITPDAVTLDANHPLAGQDLIFEIEATESREATPAEIPGSTHLH
jgi:FKBP-type peptidyl-prolyl cis-trans isomerase SlyD